MCKQDIKCYPKTNACMIHKEMVVTKYIKKQYGMFSMRIEWGGLIFADIDRLQQ